MKKSILLILSIALFNVVSAQVILKQGKTSINVSTLDSATTYLIHNDYEAGATFSLQVVYKSITGTADGVIYLYQTNDVTTTFAEIDNSQLPYSITTANGVVAFEKSVMPFAWMPLKLLKGNMTGGTIEFYLRIKKS